jgi:hypothetical protein
MNDADAADLVDALEGMVWQYFVEYEGGEYGHAFMSAGEWAAEVLARVAPGRWRLTPVGLKCLVSPWDTPGDAGAHNETTEESGK